MNKTLGQIAYDAAGEQLGSYPWNCEWEHLPEYGRIYWQAAANAIIEECAKIADELTDSVSDHEAGAAIHIAERIRALKS